MSEEKKENVRTVDFILNYVKKNELKIGSRIPAERELAEELGISRNSIREALSYLENAGMFEARQGSGVYVKGDISESLSSMMGMMTHLGKFHFDELHNFRKCMDKMVCELLVDNNDNIEAVVEEAEKILNEPANTIEEEIEKDKKFHFHLINSTKNRLLITMLTSISSTYRQLTKSFFAYADEKRKADIVDAHKEILKALQSRNLYLCSKVVDQHYMIAGGKNKDEIDYIWENLSEKDINELATEAYKLAASLKRDTLTGLYTKTYFFKKVEEYIAEHPDQELLLWTSDVIGLNVINEKYGFETGDEVLRTMSISGIPGKTILFGGRTEGDKFSALLIDEHDDLEKLNELFANQVSEKMPVANVTVKNGIYHISPGEKTTAQEMYLRTILALKEIKNDFNRYIMEYDEKFSNNLIRTRQIVSDANDALMHGQFCVYYQPKIRVSEERVGGAEALVRWIHPELGFISPGDFIPAFEQNGFIAKLDFYVWEEVCKTISEWQKNGIPAVPVSVNISRRDFQVARLAEKIIELVDSYEVDHSLIEFEITESTFTDNMDVVQSVIEKLHEAGFSISLDDFGTGYSSIISLSKLDLDVIKMDMSLIKNDDPESKRNALEFSFQLAKMINLKTVAEGIETKEQVARITALGGDYIQGYFYSKPIPKKDFESYLMKKR